MKRFALLLLLPSLLLTGCGLSDNSSSECQDPLVPIEVDLQVDNGEKDPSISVLVTHEEVPITQAYDVSFEIWQHGNEQYHFLEPAINMGSGVYAMDWTFEENGVYYIHYHVTACDMHKMEKQQIVIGDVDVEEILATPDVKRDSLMNSGNGGHSNNKH